MIKFNRGESYIATSCISGDQFVVTVAGRTGGRPIFVAGETFAAERLVVVDGREFAYIQGCDGQTYSVSSSVKAELEEAIGILEKARPPWASKVVRAARRFFFAYPEN